MLKKMLYDCFQVELVDMHYGTEADPLTNPFQFDEHLNEIHACHRISRGCFYLVITTIIVLPYMIKTKSQAHKNVQDSRIR